MADRRNSLGLRVGRGNKSSETIDARGEVMSASGWVGFALITGGLAMTSPTIEEVESDLRQKILTSINSTPVGQEAGFGEVLLTGMCKFSPEECYGILRSTMSIHTQDYFVGKAIVVRGADGSLTNCIGIVKRLWCPKFLNKET